MSDEGWSLLLWDCKFHSLIPLIQSCFVAFVAVTTPLYLKLACLLIISQAILIEGAVKLDLRYFMIYDPGSGWTFTINIYFSSVLCLYLNVAVNARNITLLCVVGSRQCWCLSELVNICPASLKHHLVENVATVWGCSSVSTTKPQIWKV